VNPNPLREAMLKGPVPIAGGRLLLSDAPELGSEPDLDALQAFRV